MMMIFFCVSICEYNVLGGSHIECVGFINVFCLQLHTRVIKWLFSSACFLKHRIRKCSMHALINEPPGVICEIESLL